jgi:ubiquitin C-terminal hydrolase
LNSILQCLAYSPPFCQSLITIAEMKIKEAQKATKPKQNQGQNVTSILSALFQKLHGMHGSATNQSSIAPQSIVKTLPHLGSIGSRNGYKFWPGRQEDAHEFLVHLLDAMHDGELRAAGINQHSSGWRDRLPASRLDETTFIVLMKLPLSIGFLGATFAVKFDAGHVATVATRMILSLICRSK